jgi:hypothetical protein
MTSWEWPVAATLPDHTYSKAILGSWQIRKSLILSHLVIYLGLTYHLDVLDLLNTFTRFAKHLPAKDILWK